MTNDTQFIMGLRVGIGAALAVTDSWDGYTRTRIARLLDEIDAAIAIEAAPAGETGTGSTRSAKAR